MTNLSLASDFPTATEAEWLALVRKTLGGASANVLRTPLYEGFETEPLYTTGDRSAPLFSHRGWHSIQSIKAGFTPAGFAVDAPGVMMVLSEAPYTLTAHDLRGAPVAAAHVYLAPGSSPADAAVVLAARDEASITGAAGFDPLTTLARTGERAADPAVFLADDVDAAVALKRLTPSFVPFLASGDAWHGAGGSAVQELAFTLAAGVTYWRALADVDTPIAGAAASIGFQLSATADIFLTIATFRAMRLLWARALAAAEVAPNANLMLLAKMSARMLTAYDRHVNALRATAAVFGAAIGGATGIEVLPFDDVAGGPSNISNRLARNTSLVLGEESHLGAVADAAAGSNYIENLTESLASRAWTLFREIEARGGLARALETGFVQAALHQTASARASAVAHRKDKITGVTAFPNLAETAPSDPIPAVPGDKAGHPASRQIALPPPGRGERFAALLSAARAGAAVGDLRIATRSVPDIACEPVAKPFRGAEPFETLRYRADLALSAIGSRPPVFLAGLGAASSFRARAAWVQGFFAAGGIDVLASEHGFETGDALVSAFRQSPAPAVCLCGADAAYDAMRGVASALKRAGAVVVYLAGPPSILKTLSPEDLAAVDRVIYDGCDVLALLREAHRIMRVEELSDAAKREAEDEDLELYGTAGRRLY